LVKKDGKSIKPVNYTIDNQKITFEFLKSPLWSAADILRGFLDPSEYRQPVMTLLFLKRLNDTFEENAENLINKEKAKKILLRIEEALSSLFLKKQNDQSIISS
jgi:type I restriction-modification system DNA methylase subunit